MVKTFGEEYVNAYVSTEDISIDLPLPLSTSITFLVNWDLSHESVIVPFLLDSTVKLHVGPVESLKSLR